MRGEQCRDRGFRDCGWKITVGVVGLGGMIPLAANRARCARPPGGRPDRPGRGRTQSSLCSSAAEADWNFVDVAGGDGLVFTCTSGGLIETLLNLPPFIVPQIPAA